VSDPLVRLLLVALAVTVAAIAALIAGWLGPRRDGESVPRAVRAAGGAYGASLALGLALVAATSGP
jgi:hypothetical protein